MIRLADHTFKHIFAHWLFIHSRKSALHYFKDIDITACSGDVPPTARMLFCVLHSLFPGPLISYFIVVKVGHRLVNM